MSPPARVSGLRHAAGLMVAASMLGAIAHAEPPARSAGAIPTPACLWGEVEKPDPRMLTLEHGFLVREEFRLGSRVYPAMPADGFPIRFLDGGVLESKQYPPGTWWALIHGALKIVRPEGLPSDVYSLDPACGTLVSRHGRDEKTIRHEIRLAPGRP